MQTDVAKPSLTCHVVAVMVLVLLALWFGGLAHTLLSVGTLFTQFPKLQTDVAVLAAPAIFFVTERALLIIGSLAVVGSAALWLMVSIRGWRVLTIVCFIALLLNATQTFFVSAQMDALRSTGESGGASFQTLHKVSNVQYLAQTTLVLVGLIAFPAASRGEKVPAVPQA